jgi:SEC-C motif-containing protein
MDDCPCGSNFPYTDCCGPLVRETSFADTAEDLMRSRFTAYATKNWSYLVNTLHPDEQDNKTVEGIASHNENIEWHKLEILSSKAGQFDDQRGEVTFVASYSEQGARKTMQETSTFLKVEGRWYYSEKNSQLQKTPAEKIKPAEPKQPFIRENAKVGRNDPCPCNSGKKFKKCCGK